MNKPYTTELSERCDFVFFTINLQNKQIKILKLIEFHVPEVVGTACNSVTTRPSTSIHSSLPIALLLGRVKSSPKIILKLHRTEPFYGRSSNHCSVLHQELRTKAFLLCRSVVARLRVQRVLVHVDPPFVDVLVWRFSTATYFF